MENICEILHYGLKHIILTCQLTVLSTRPQRFVIVTTIRFPFPVMIFWIDVPHKSGLCMITGTSLHLQKLMYFPQMRLVSQQAVSLMQCFFFCQCFIQTSVGLPLRTLNFHFLSHVQLSLSFSIFWDLDIQFYICSSISFLFIVYHFICRISFH